MTFSESTSSVLSKYATFSGRAARSEYWWFALFAAILNFASTLADRVVFGAPTTVFGAPMAVFGAIVGIGLLLPSIAVSVRRLHDLDRTGWWLKPPELGAHRTRSGRGTYDGL